MPRSIRIQSAGAYYHVMARGNRPEAIVEGGRVTRYGYDLGGRAVVLVAGNGQVSNNSYDALGRLKNRTLFRTQTMSEADVLAEFGWEHDLLGNVTQQHELWPGEVTRQGGIRSTVMSYDGNNRLTGEAIFTRTTDSAPAVEQSRTEYSYDTANNRATKTVTRLAAAASSTEAGENDVGHWAYTYNSANQLIGWTHSDYPSGTTFREATLTYDDAGNRIAQNVTTLNSQPETLNTEYSWDAQDRLTAVTMPDGSEHSYDYDYRTRRIETSRSGGILPPTSTARMRRTSQTNGIGRANPFEKMKPGQHLGPEPSLAKPQGKAWQSAFPHWRLPSLAARTMRLTEKRKPTLTQHANALPASEHLSLITLPRHRRTRVLTGFGNNFGRHATDLMMSRSSCSQIEQNASSLVSDLATRRAVAASALC
ncbi:hypothetical protein [Prosthecobacter sp.]|uniref:RHS repeat domain-containing protein n=1 Tax=Prosthecobacter sp. TaxID=1965333 RepID=UPI002ABB3BA6|nr:hypothetical protein [Prosthecobacter sp.]MDZ4402142.1 hypothetical protein [Prosthecobacter sp.]